MEAPQGMTVTSVLRHVDAEVLVVSGSLCVESWWSRFFQADQVMLPRLRPVNIVHIPGNALRREPRAQLRVECPRPCDVMLSEHVPISNGLVKPEFGAKKWFLACAGSV